MLWKDRLISALLAVTVVSALSVVVLRVSPDKPALAPAQLEQGITYAATGVDPDTIILRVDGNGAEAELLTYEIGYSCAYLNSMLQSYTGESLDPNGTLPGGENAGDYIREESLRMVKQVLVAENLAQRYGVTLSETDEQELAQNRVSLVEQFGEDGYRAELYKLGVSEKGYDRSLRANYLYNALYNLYNTSGSALYADEDVLRAYAAGAGYITADHILLMTIDPETREPLPEATVAEKRQLAEDLLWQLRDSSDPVTLFAALADEYGEDPGREEYPTGYTFTEGRMVDAFDSAARALEENEYSDVVESEFGYHIILRRPLDAAAAADAVRDEYFDVMFLAELDKAEEEISPEVEKFDVKAIYEALQQAQSAE